MGVGASGVVDYVNTTSSLATGVVANGTVGGIGVVAEYSGSVYWDYFLITEDGDKMLTESSEFLIATLTTPPGGSYIMTQNNNNLTDESLNKLITE